MKFEDLVTSVGVSIQKVSTAPGAKSKVIEVPLTALHNHNVTVLDSVDIKLKFVASEENINYII